MSARALQALPSVPVVIAERQVRCHVLRRHGRNPCPNPAMDPDAETPLCFKHLTRACQDAIRLLGRPNLELIIGDGQ